MNCLDCKKKLVEFTGHAELVVDAVNGDWTDAGALFHLNAGGKFLDRFFEYRRDSAWIYTVLSAGVRKVSFSGARYIEEVWLARENENRKRLTYTRPAEFRTLYPGDPGTLVNGTPCAWTLDAVGLYPQQIDQDEADLITAGAVDYQHLTFGSWYLTDSIVFDVPADDAYTVWIKAKYYNVELANDIDVNFWTLNAPELLIDAATRSVEHRLHRNSTGVRDVEDPLVRDLRQIANDLFSQETEGPRGEWRMLA